MNPMVLVGGSLLTIIFANSSVDKVVCFVHVHLFHAVLFPLTENLVDVFSTFNFGCVQSDYTRSRLNLENPCEPVLAPAEVLGSRWEGFMLLGGNGFG